jgi:GAF domain-containing protein
VRYLSGYSVGSGFPHRGPPRGHVVNERPGTGGTYPHGLVEAIESLSRLVVSDEDVTSTVQRIAEMSVHAVEGAENCSVSQARGGKIKTLASTSDVGRAIDRIQYETNEGPCLSAIRKEATFHIPDMENDDTWPTFSKRASEETGIKSMLSFVLELHDDGALGAVNLASTTKDAFDDDDVATGTLFAVQAGIALANALAHESDRKEIEELQAGMVTRQMIGQAVGIIMSTRGLAEKEAFDILVRISQTTNTKLRDIAEKVVGNVGEL